MENEADACVAKILGHSGGGGVEVTGLSNPPAHVLLTLLALLQEVTNQQIGALLLPSARLGWHAFEALTGDSIH